MVAQHRAAIRLRELKDRARDVAERRSRYGVEVPEPLGARDEEQDGDDEIILASVAMDHSAGSRRAFSWPAVEDIEDYFHGKLADWMKQVRQGNIGTDGSKIPSIAFVAPGPEDAEALANEALSTAATRFKRKVIFVDIPAMDNISYQALETKDILGCILQELEFDKSQSHQHGENQGEGEEQHLHWYGKRTRDIHYDKRKVTLGIMESIQEMKIDHKIANIKNEIHQMDDGLLQKLENDLLDPKQMKETHMLDRKPLGVLLQLLSKSAAAAEQDQVRKKKSMPTLAPWYSRIIDSTALKLKNHMEAQEAKEIGAEKIRLDNVQYAEILLEVFRKTSNSEPLHNQLQGIKQATKSITGTTILDEDQIKDLGDQGQIREHVIDETTWKIDKIQQIMKEKMIIKGIVEKIQNQLEREQTMFVLRMDQVGWEEARNALSLLGCVAGAVIVTTSKNTQRAKEYFSPLQEPMDYSRVGLYHHMVLELTNQQKNEDSSYDPQIFRAILDKCDSYEFCMKIFARALYANPKRSNAILRNLYCTLHASPRSLGSVAKNMLQFSYSNLPEEYKSCLLSLAIFPHGFRIRRSTLIGRWVVEGLIAKEDWPSSVDQANQCFDTLIDRWFICPTDVSARGQVKTCAVGDLVHGFITNIARKKGIIGTDLPHHLARHFPIFSNTRLQSYATLSTFFYRLAASTEISLIKVIDLEDCFYYAQRNLKDICNKMLLLKYLNLRGTNIDQLPSEINNLHELEILDIRQTKVPAFATRKLLLLKLKCLLAGHIDLSPGEANRAEEFSSVWIPENIEKMMDMEVLSNVMAPSSRHLKDIGKLWRLRKLGVVIKDKYSHLRNLFATINDLHESLISLSITIPATRMHGIHSIGEFPHHMCSLLKYSPKLLESLSIIGTTESGLLLQILLVEDRNKLNKVILTRTSLSQNDLKVLANLPNLCCVRLHDIECTKTNLTFTDNEFQKLKYFLVERSNLTEISFENGAHELEKIILSSTNIDSINGVDRLTKLEELELNNNSRLLPFFDNAKQIVKVTLRSTFLTQGDLQTLAKKPNMRCLVLVDISWEESQLTFKKDDFPKLNLLVVDSSLVRKICFNSGTAPKLEKITWTFTNMESLSGIENLLKLKELELNGSNVPDEVKEAIKRHKNKPHYKHNDHKKAN